VEGGIIIMGLVEKQREYIGTLKNEIKSETTNESKGGSAFMVFSYEV